MNLRKRILLGMFGGNITKYLVRDDYVTAQLAGAVNGTLAEPGGLLGTPTQNTRNVVDTGSGLAISTGRARTASRASATDPRLYYGPFTRDAGLTAKCTFQWTSPGGVGWSVTTNCANGDYRVGLHAQSAAQLLPNSINPDYGGSSHTFFAGDTDYTLWFTLFALGGAIWAQGGAYTDPTLIWIHHLTNNTPVYFMALKPSEAGGGGIAQIDDLKIKVVPTLASAQTIASVYITNPVSGTSYTAPVDGFHHVDITAPGTWHALDRQELRFRIQDADNYWTYYVERNAGDTNWDMKLDLVESGVATNKQVYNNLGQAPTALMVRAIGSNIMAYNYSWSAWEAQMNEITDATFATSGDIAFVANAGSATLLKSFKRTWTL
jgi:hypothetical protein